MLLDRATVAPDEPGIADCICADTSQHGDRDKESHDRPALTGQDRG
jgi:hypothetical protein